MVIVFDYLQYTKSKLDVKPLY